MDDNRFDGEFFDCVSEENAKETNNTPENIMHEPEYESVTEEKEEEADPLKNSDETEVKEAEFEDTAVSSDENREAFFQNYPRPNIPHPETPEEPKVTFESEPVSEPVSEPESQPENTFNPYAPRNGSQNDPAQQVSPGYTQINRPAYQQQNQYQNQPYGHMQYGSQPQFQGQNSYSQIPPQNGQSGKSKGKTVAGVILVACLALAIIGLLVGIFSDDKPDVQNTTTTLAGQTTTQNAAQQATSSENIEVSTTEPVTAAVNSVFVADKVRPSVVGVMTYADGMLSGEGSGVLMSEKDGWTYIVTCAHVISEEGVTYGVLLLDGRRFEAQLVAYDNRTDIGVVKVEATGLPLAEFGDSTALKIGEPVYAIGNPGGSEYFGSITNGIVSAIDRSVTSTYTMTCIQHNAAINPGNSGGALVNSAGQVIGINSSKIASTEYEGMGFAVPTSIASPIVNALIQYGYVPNRPKLGIEYAPVSSYQLYSLVVSIKGLPQGSLVIAGISEDSSLAGTEAEVGDLIIAVNGKNMDDTSVLLDFIETGSVGDTLTLTLCRIESRTYRTSTFDVTITLVEDKPSATEEVTTPSTEYQDDGYYRGGTDNFEDFFNDYFGW